LVLGAKIGIFREWEDDFWGTMRKKVSARWVLLEIKCNFAAGTFFESYKMS
jgi:hypothetical protein